jgi:hypothetical protein
MVNGSLFGEALPVPRVVVDVPASVNGQWSLVNGQWSMAASLVKRCRCHASFWMYLRQSIVVRRRI